MPSSYSWRLCAVHAWGKKHLWQRSDKCDNYIQWCSVVKTWCSVVKTMYSWLIIRCVVGEQIQKNVVVSVLWSCQVWDIVQQQLRAGSIVQLFSERRSIYMSLCLYGYVDMGGCVCIVVFYCQMVLVGWLEFKSLRHLVISAPSQIGT
jgi:hypothetical protein